MTPDDMTSAAADRKPTTAAEAGALPRWRKPVYSAYSVKTATLTRTCGTGSDSFPGWCALTGS